MTDHPLSILIMNRKYDNTIGGVERVSISLANEMVARGHQCHILSLDRSDAVMHFEMAKNVKWHKISCVSADHKAGFFERLRRLIVIRGILKQHKIDVAIGFQDGAYLSLIVAALFTGVPVIAAERNAPSRFDYLKNKNMREFVFNSFRFAQGITVQCPSYVGEYPSYLHSKITVIPNPVMPANSYAQPALASDGRKTILFVGRLDYQKNLATLIHAFALLATEYPLWDLKLVGDGHDRSKLQTLCETLQLKDRVLFEGSQKDIGPYYRGANIFCLPSLWEGFPNALAEAMAHALPSCGFAKCSGVKDLIENGITGFLADGDVRRPEILADSLKRLMDDPALCQKMGAAGLEKSKTYAPASVFGQWEDIFQAVAAKR